MEEAEEGGQREAYKKGENATSGEPGYGGTSQGNKVTSNLRTW